MATYFSVLAWKIPWTEQPGRLHSTGSQRVRYNLATKQQHSYLNGAEKPMGCPPSTKFVSPGFHQLMCNASHFLSSLQSTRGHWHSCQKSYRPTLYVSHLPAFQLVGQPRRPASPSPLCSSVVLDILLPRMQSFSQSSADHLRRYCLQEMSGHVCKHCGLSQYGGMLLLSSGQRPGMLFSNMQYTHSLPQKRITQPKRSTVPRLGMCLP